MGDRSRGHTRTRVVLTLSHTTRPVSSRARVCPSSRRYEIADISVDHGTREAMEKQSNAKRLRRAEVLESQGYREKQINQSEGDRQSAINSSQVYICTIGPAYPPADEFTAPQDPNLHFHAWRQSDALSRVNLSRSVW